VPLLRLLVRQHRVPLRWVQRPQDHRPLGHSGANQSNQPMSKSIARVLSIHRSATYLELAVDLVAEGAEQLLPVRPASA
jgi:hypothetical protein